MRPWSARETFDVLLVGRRLGLVMLGVAVYCVAAGFAARWLELRPIELGTAASLINTLILGLLLGFRNEVAYQRWWEAHGLWGQLTNHSRNLAAKCAASVPADLVTRSGIALLVANFAEALNRHLRDQPLRLRDLPGFEGETSDRPHVPLEIARRLFAVLGQWKRGGHLDTATFLALDPHAPRPRPASGRCRCSCWRASFSSGSS